MGKVRDNTDSRAGALLSSDASKALLSGPLFAETTFVCLTSMC